MNANQKIRIAKLSKWHALFKEQAESGLPVKEWCDKKGISKNSFYYWKRIAKESYADSMLPDIVKLPEEPTPTTDSLNTQTNLLPELPNLHNLCNTPPTNTISVSFDDIRLDIGPSASGQLVAKLIEVLRHA